MPVECWLVSEARCEEGTRCLAPTSRTGRRPGWTLGAPDVARAAEFYGSVFGWQFESAGPEAGGYGMFTQGGKVVAAAGPLTEQGAAPSWTLYFKTSDADATAGAVRKAGGAVRAESADVMSEGRFAQFTDPAGAMFAVWQPGNTKGLGAVNDPGTLCWTELATPDVPGAKSFYSDVLGWETDDQPMGGFTYTVIRPAAVRTAARAGSCRSARRWQRPVPPPGGSLTSRSPTATPRQPR